jgi:hypothetical protein
LGWFVQCWWWSRIVIVIDVQVDIDYFRLVAGIWGRNRNRWWCGLAGGWERLLAMRKDGFLELHVGRDDGAALGAVPETVALRLSVVPHEG